MIESMRQKLEGKVELLCLTKHSKKSGLTNEESFKNICEKIQSATKNKIGDSQKATIGVMEKEQHKGQFSQNFEQYLSKQEYNLKDISPLISKLLSVKSKASQVIIKNFNCKVLQKMMRFSAAIASYYSKILVEEIEGIIDDETKVKHSDLSAKIEKMIEDKAIRLKLANCYKLQENFVDLCYSPVIQSNGVYDIKPITKSNDDFLEGEIIIIRVGGDYKNYKSNIVRTLIIDPTPEQKKNYMALNLLKGRIIEDMNPGVTFSEVYHSAVKLFTQDYQQLVKHLPEKFGQGIGLEFIEEEQEIREGNSSKIVAGMVLNVTVSLENLEKDDKIYTLMIAETVLIQQHSNKVLTSGIKSSFEEISYTFDQDEKPNTTEPNDVKTGPKTRYRGVQSVEQTKENNRIKNQKEILKRLQAEVKRRYEAGEFQNEKRKQVGFQLESIESYRAGTDFSLQAKRQKIRIDTKNKSIILPVSGKYVPFHISVIKNISKQDQEGFMSLRINFATPATYAQNKNLIFPEMKQEHMFIKEMKFRSKNKPHIRKLYSQINEMKKIQKVYEQEQIDKKNFIKQERLILIQGKKLSLDNIRIRPQIGGRKILGKLTAHKNGFRYDNQRNQSIEIVLKNIKHAFFQPCDRHIFVLIHFHLNNEIKIGKKMTTNIQFYIEVGSAAIDIDSRYGRRQEMNEYEEEQRLKQTKKRLNQEFKGFCEAAQKQYGADHFHVDGPYPALGFWGCPHKMNVFLMPTISCLVNLIEQPPFVMSLKEVEIAHFERVSYNLRNFDLAFVFKDYTRLPLRINAIPTTHLETIKNWLNEMDILFSQGSQNYNWKNLMKTIRDDIGSFITQGCWGFLQDEDTGEEEKSEDSIDKVDSDFKISEEESYHSESNDGSEFTAQEEVIDDISEEDNYVQEEEEENEGLSWDELDRKARRADLKRSMR